MDTFRKLSCELRDCAEDRDKERQTELFVDPNQWRVSGSRVKHGGIMEQIPTDIYSTEPPGTKIRCCRGGGTSDAIIRPESNENLSAVFFFQMAI